MGLRIRTNIASLRAQRELSNSTTESRDSMAKLSSGKRINKAADDAAGLGISENLRSDIRSLVQAKRNAADGISIIQTAEGALNESTNMLIRLREIAVQAASDTVSNKERAYIQKEYTALKDEIDRIANATEFNGTKLLAGDRENAPSGLNFEEDNAFPLQIQVGKDFISEVDDMDADNAVNVIKIDFTQIDGYTEGLGIGQTGESDETKVSTREEAQNSISRLDEALSKVSNYRSYLGSMQNRMNSTINNVSLHVENLQDAKSRVVDADFASETARFTQANILEQAGTSVLSQAKSHPQLALSLLN